MESERRHVEPPYSVKVHQLLEQVHHLQDGMVKEDGGGEPTKALLLQCEIFCCFSIIDWIIGLEDGRRKELPEEEAAHLEGLKTQVALEREAAKATKEDLKSLKIPYETKRGVMGGAAGNVEWFPNYLQLPALMVREKILKNLTDPQDRLNLVRAIPSEGPLMGWDLTCLQLQVVFPILMTRRALAWKEIHSLSQVNGAFRDCVLRYFEDQHLSKPRRRSIMTPDSLIDTVIQCGDPEGPENPELEWSWRFNPTSDLFIIYDGHCETREVGICELLELLGPRSFLICTICVNDRRPAAYQLESVSRYLTRMSNLMSLVVSLEVMRFPWDDPELETEQGTLTLEDIQLPELKSLKRFALCGTGSHKIALAKQRLLEKYAPGLLQLEVNDDYPEMEDSFRIDSPFLYQLDVKGKQENLDLFFRYAKLFLGSTLKKIKLEVVEPNGRSRFASLMQFLSGHFGGSLEELTVYLGIGTSDQRYSKSLEMEEQRPGSPPSPPSTWMLDCKFPKLKGLLLDCFPCFEGMAFLLLFPALENLTFAKIDKPQQISYDAEDGILHVSVSSQELMSRAAIWKLLPRLEVMAFKGYRPWGDERNPEEWQVTRKEMVGYQADN